jgi:hypothetical protein
MFFDCKASGGSSGKSQAVQDLRRSREQRQRQRDHGAVALRLQRVWRGRGGARKALRELGSEVDRKLGDVLKLGTVLGSKGIKFVPPAEICFDLTRKILFILRYSKKVSFLYQ